MTYEQGPEHIIFCEKTNPKIKKFDHHKIALETEPFWKDHFDYSSLRDVCASMQELCNLLTTVRTLVCHESVRYCKLS